ncbi:hypothetical protein [Kitasatospora sp. NPDC006786]|uniref:hypothetical protein n=1 Tax=unclassified Kitasatospora TaxID=2633591 RepID=UPI00337EBA9F
MSKSNPVRKLVGAVTDAVSGKMDHGRPEVPGAPGVQPPPVAEPTEPRAPLPPKPDQSPPAVLSATGRRGGGAEDARAASSVRRAA